MPKTASKKKVKTKNVPTKRLTRKELRKQKHGEKMEKKRLYFSSKTQGKELVAAAAKEQQLRLQNKQQKKKNKVTKKPQMAPEDMPIEELLSGVVDSDADESIASDFSDDEVDKRMPAQANKGKQPATAKDTNKRKVKMHTEARPDAAVTRRRELARQKDLEQASRKQRIKQLKVENEEEEIMIARLEKKLGLNKTKDKNRLMRKMFSDGLDYVLEFCLDDEEEKQKRELKEKRKKEAQKRGNAWSDEEEEMMFGDDDDSRESAAGDEDDDSENEEASKPADSDAASDSSEQEDEPIDATEQYKEDIYGRKRDKDGNIIKAEATNGADATTQPPQRYIPPHQRQLQAAQVDSKQAQQLERLRKHCKGLLNRLSEANLHKIANGIEELYMKNSRFNMNETLTALLSEALLGRTLCNERMVQEHMVLLAFLHAQVGSEIGAHFLQVFVEQFDAFMREMDTLQVEDKRLNNLVLLLSYMYIFKIYEHRLLLQFISKLASQLCEKAIECLLLIFQSVGFKLRKDDPLAFKQMMLSVQQQIAAAPLELKDNLRLKFMVDILNAVKNNNINKLPQFNPELAETLRKRLKAMLRHDKYVITLNITMEDLLRVDQVGKWWIVGSAWSGNINDVGAAAQSTKDAADAAAAERFSEKLLTLARQQKMNTEERRNIFCIIMSAEDYVDAFEKILHLGLKDQRSIAYVIIHCCLNEKLANPYYAHLALKFCHYNRKFQLAFQFASWDRINDIGALSRQQLKNFAKFLQQLILAGGLQLSVLKVIDFLQLNKSSMLLMKDIMVGLLLGENESEVYQIFERVAKNTKLNQFKNSIRLFMQHFLLQQQEEATKLKLTEEQLALLRKRVDYADNLLAYVDL